MTPAEAHAAAAAEGLALLRTENSTGFKGVCHNSNQGPQSINKPFQAQVRHDGRNKLSICGPTAPKCAPCGHPSAVLLHFAALVLAFEFV